MGRWEDEKMEIEKMRSNGIRKWGCGMRNEKRIEDEKMRQPYIMPGMWNQIPLAIFRFDHLML
jgi:hypothetical protein